MKPPHLVIRERRGGGTKAPGRRAPKAPARATVNRLVLGDALVVAPLLPAGEVDLLYLDPPFATGRAWRGRRGASEGTSPPAFADRWEGGLAGYLDWLAAMLSAARRLLAPTGSVVLHLDYRAAPAARLLLDALFGPEHCRGEIIWHYGSGGRARRHFHRKHDTLLWYSRGPRYRFFPDAVSVPRALCPACGRERESWNHLRRHTDEAGRTYRSIRSAGREYRYFDDERVIPSDVWQDISHLQQRDPERVGWPTQKPLRLLARLVAAFTQPGDLVADLCVGSGTTLEAAAQGSRRWLGVDLSPDAVALSWQRLTSEGRGRSDAALLTCGVEGWVEGALERSATREALSLARARPDKGWALALIAERLGGGRPPRLAE